MTRYRRLAAIITAALLAVGSAPAGALAGPAHSTPTERPTPPRMKEGYIEWLIAAFGVSRDTAKGLVDWLEKESPGSLNSLGHLLSKKQNVSRYRATIRQELGDLLYLTQNGLHPASDISDLLNKLASFRGDDFGGAVAEINSGVFIVRNELIEPGSQFLMGAKRKVTKGKKVETTFGLRRQDGSTVEFDPGDTHADLVYVNRQAELTEDETKLNPGTFFDSLKKHQFTNMERYAQGETGSSGGLKRQIGAQIDQATGWPMLLPEVFSAPDPGTIVQDPNSPITRLIDAHASVRIGDRLFNREDLIRLRTSAAKALRVHVKNGGMPKDQFIKSATRLDQARKLGIEVPEAKSAQAANKNKEKAKKAQEKIAENLGCKGQPAVGMARGSAPVLAAVPMAAAACPAGKQQSSGLAQALQNPGGIDFTSLGLRYMSDDPGSGGVQYAFSGNPASPGITQNTDTGVDAVTNSTADLRTWLVLSPQTFWVNLNPSQPDKIVDAKLGRTNAGKALLEADLRLKQTSAKLLNPKTSLGARYWKALGNDTCYSDRLWITPGDVQVREDGSSLYVLRADLSVKTQTMNIDNVGSKSCHPDPDTAARMEKLERTAVLPKIIKAVNTEAGYAPLRRAFLARVVAQWIRDRHAAGHRTSFDDLLGSGDLGPATLTDGWRPRQVFDTYVHSVKDGAFTYKKTVRIGNRIYKQSETVGGVDFSRLNPSRIGAAQMNQQHPHLAQTVRNAASRPANDSDGTIWLGATAPTPDPGPWANATGTIGDFVTSRTGILVLVVVALGVLTFGIRGGRRKRPAA